MSGFDFELYLPFRRAIDLRETDPDEAIRLLTQVRDAAIKKQNHEWRLRAEHWRIQTYITGKKDFKAANRHAIEAAVESRQAKYHQYQEYICVQNDLMLVYNGIDPVGYADDIKQAIDISIDMTTSDMACHYCLNRDVIDYHKYLGEDEAARNQAAKFFAMTYQQTHYRIQAYEQLCYFAYQDQSWDDLRSLARDGAQMAGDNEKVPQWINLKAYEMLALQMLGQLDEAQKAYDLLQYRVSILKMVQGYIYYSMMTAYHEAQNDLQQALNTINEYLNSLLKTGRPYWESKARLEQIRLLKALKQPYDDAMLAFKQVTRNLKAQSQFDAQLETILKA